MVLKIQNPPGNVLKDDGPGLEVHEQHGLELSLGPGQLRVRYVARDCHELAYQNLNRGV